MARRRSKRKSGFEALLELPWHALILLAAAVYAVFTWIIPAMVGSNPILKPLIQMMRGVAWIPATGLGLLAVISYFAKRKHRAVSVPAFIPAKDELLLGEPWKNPAPSALDEAWDLSIRPPKKITAPTDVWSLDLLRELEWKRFEIVCASYYQKQGFRVETIRCGADGGIDAKLYWRDETNPAAILQCKAWNAYQVGVKPVRELLGVMAHNGVAKGIFLATKTFTIEAIEFASKNPIELVTGEDLLCKINLLSLADSADLLKIATAGDYLTPSCPSCGIKMVKRLGNRGHFWGCKNYPRCRPRFVVRERA